MWGVAIAPAPIRTTPLLRPQRPLPLPQQHRRRRQRSLPPLSSHCAGIRGVERGFRLCGSPDAVSMAAPLRATTSSSSAPPAADPSNGGTEMPALSVEKDDLLIVGAGVLGRIVAEKWKKDHPGCQTFGETLTTNHHDELLKLGIKPLLSGFNNSRFPFVIFCAPPSRSADYLADVRVAASNWSGEGAFLFTSSSAVYDCNDNGLCNEDSPVVPIGRSPRTDVLLKAETAVLDSGGCVLRLDAASLSVAILKKQFRNRIFMGCDNHPLSRQEMMDCVNRSAKFDKVFQKFTGTDGPLGKRMNNSKTRAEVGWQPKYTSFPSFLGLTE